MNLDNLGEFSTYFSKTSSGKTMSDYTPSMTESRFDLLQVVQAHKEYEAAALMSAMIMLEKELSSTIRNVSHSIREKSDPKTRIEEFNGILERSLRLGANDLVAVTRTALISHKAGDRSGATADALLWLTIAEQTRIANIAFFQACQLFGRALNGKSLPSVDGG
jgi:hypothetical protein